MSKHDEDLLKARNDNLERKLKDLPVYAPCAFTVPHTAAAQLAAGANSTLSRAAEARTKLWVQSPSGHFMLLSGSWMFTETARLYAVRCGYRLIDSDKGLLLVEQQMNARGLPAEREQLH